MLFVAAAFCQGLLNAFSSGDSLPAQSETYAFARAVCYVLVNTYAVKMAAVFIIVTSTIGFRTAIFPRWMVFVGYLLAGVMLLMISGFAWIALVFPSWVLLLSGISWSPILIAQDEVISLERILSLLSSPE